MNRIATYAALLAAPLLAACGTTQACDDYVDYMCDCHPEADCQDLERQFGGATDPELQDECILALDEQQEIDEEAGHVCGESTPVDDTGA